MEIRVLVRKVQEGYAVFVREGKRPDERLPGATFQTRYQATKAARKYADAVIATYRALSK